MCEFKGKRKIKGRNRFFHHYGRIWKIKTLHSFINNAWIHTRKLKSSLSQRCSQIPKSGVKLELTHFTESACRKVEATTQVLHLAAVNPPRIPAIRVLFRVSTFTSPRNFSSGDNDFDVIVTGTKIACWDCRNIELHCWGIRGRTHFGISPVYNPLRGRRNEI